jgi:hypothetical protein
MPTAKGEANGVFLQPVEDAATDKFLYTPPSRLTTFLLEAKRPEVGISPDAHID